MSRVKSIYNNPYKYAYKCDVPIELARAVCKYQRKLEKMTRKAAKCPMCNTYELVLEHGSYEEGYDDYIYCDSCDQSFSVAEIENGYLLYGWSDFDIILWYSCNSTKEANRKQRAEELGINTLEEWQEWAWRQYRRY